MLDDASIATLLSEFGRRIRNDREAKDLRPKQLAALVGLTRSSIANIEAGRQRTPIHVIWRLSAALNLPVADLVPERSVLKGPTRTRLKEILRLEPRLQNVSAASRAKVRDFVAAKLAQSDRKPEA